MPEVMLPLTLFLAGFALRARDVMTARPAAQAADIEAERGAYAQLSVATNGPASRPSCMTSSRTRSA